MPRLWQHGWPLSARIMLNRTTLHVLLFICAGLSPVRGQDVLISEFMAVNNATLQDDDNDFSDWIELHNTTPATVSLDGWYLTDRDDNLTKWRIPDVDIAADGFLVIFASGKDRTNTASSLHANFSLSGGGEYLALVRPNGTTVEFAYAPSYPAQSAGVAPVLYSYKF